MKYTSIKFRIITIVTLVGPGEKSSHSKTYSLRFILILDNNPEVDIIGVKSWPTMILVEDICFTIGSTTSLHMSV